MIYKSLTAALLFYGGTYAQVPDKPSLWAIGFSYGNGSEFKNTDYTYTNSYFQGQVYYSLNSRKKWEYQLALQPEINFARHRLKNYYFVKPDDPDFEQKREVYMKLKDIREYILNAALCIRYNVTDDFSVYAMGNVGPMITDTDTERLTKGFAFCDVFALGLSYDVGIADIDIRANARHVSNAGLQDSNAGFNTKNFALGIVFPL